MVMPMVSRGLIRRLWTLLPAVTAATTPLPRAFTAAWIRMVPTAVMENWRAMGRPINSSWRSSEGSGRQSSRSRRSRGTRRRIYSRHRRPEIPWERTVAQAAPATPIPKQRIKTRSKAMFRRAAAVRKKRGVRLSPRARRMPERRLYSMVAGMPPKTMTI